MTDLLPCGHERRPIPVSARGKHLVIDIHCHLGCEAADAIVRAAVPGPPPSMPFISDATRATNAKMFAGIWPTLNGIDTRLADMDRLGVDVQALSPNPAQYLYGLDPEITRETSRTINNWIAEAVAGHPDRFVGMGTVPLQSPELAVAEMRRCVTELDLRGIEIGTNVAGRELAEPEFAPFFAAAEELGVLLFIHPLGFTHGHRLAEHYLNNIIGNPIESTIALSHLIFGGVLDRHAGLKLLVAHGGGYLPGYWGRMDHAWRAREDCRQFIDRPPSSYLRQIWLDTLVFDKDELDSLVRTHGVDRLCLGTDYPFDMGEPDPLGFHDRLDGATRRAIVGGNAADLLGLAI